MRRFGRCRPFFVLCSARRWAVSRSLEVEVELTKLARVLGTDAQELDFLEGTDLAALRELRNSVSDHLIRQGQADFDRVGAVARYLPTGVAAKLADHALGPQLSGRMAGLLSLEQIAEFVDRLPASFLAELAPVVDLRAIGPLIAAISEPKLAAAARVLIERDDWITIAAFIDSTPPRGWPARSTRSKARRSCGSASRWRAVCESTRSSASWRTTSFASC